jgi:hypothetical protein
MQINGEDIYIGLFNTVEEAIVTRDLKFKQLAGEFYKS